MKPVVMLATGSEETAAMFHRLDEAVGVERVLIEPPVGFVRMLRTRARMLGYVETFGQALFRLAIVPVLEWRSRPRRRAIALRAGLEPAEIPPQRIAHVPSVNDDVTIELLRTLAPRVVVLSGTRIVSARVLASIDAPVVNMHAGITPRYRGVHGGYWALAMADRDHCGVTVHLVDPGVDTGDVLAQATIEPTADDDFTTYPWLQLAAGLPLLVESVRRVLAGDVRTHQPGGPSRQWFHPTAWGYLARRVRAGVR